MKDPLEYKERSYRGLVRQEGLQSFRVCIQETDLLIRADKNLEQEASRAVTHHRNLVEDYIRENPKFVTALTPWVDKAILPKILYKMISAGQAANVGPMAAVAGAVSEAVGLELLKYSDQVIVENGGDVFLKMSAPTAIGLFAGESPFSMKMGIRVDATSAPLGVCTSSGTVGHSLSRGKADAVCAISHDCALADAVATAAGNLVQNKNEVLKAVEFAMNITGITGAVAVMDDQIAAMGELEIVPL